VLSGVPLLLLKGYIDSLTWIKLFLVLMVGLNGIFLHGIKRGFERAIARRSAIPPLYEFRIMLATAISQIGWWGAVVIGFAHRHIAHFIPWPESPWPAIALLIGAMLVAFAAGEAVFARSKK
jgi:hypothetical protein